MAKFRSAPRQTQPSPVNTRDNLRSRDKFEIILGLCHGPIKGLTNGGKSLYLDGTPFIAQDGLNNFPNVEYRFYPGNTPGETIRPILGGYEDWRGYLVGMAQNVPVQFATQTLSTTQVILRFKVKKLYIRGRNSIFGYEADGTGPNVMRVKVDIQSNGGSWNNEYGGIREIVGRTLEPQVHEIRIQFPDDGLAPYNVRVTLLTGNSSDNACEVDFEGYYEVQEGIYGLTKSTTVNVPLAPLTPVIRTTDPAPERTGGGNGIDMIDIRLTVGQLAETRQPSGTPGTGRYDPGGTFESEIVLLIEHRRTQQPTLWLNAFNGTVKIRGKTTSPVVFEYRIAVPAVDDRWDIRVTRISGDIPDHVRSISWESFQEIIGGPVRFDGVACLDISGRATNSFSSYPEISGEYDLKLCKIPTNYDPYTRTYTGTWDGTFKLDWTNNPAWCVYDLVMNDQYGARRFWPELNMDRLDCYEAGKWCDELVPDGRGGWQPRYTMNLEISEARGIREQIRYMAGAFNAIPVEDDQGTMRLFVDKDEEATAIFLPENVYEGVFDYSYSDPDTRFNEILVKYVDAERNYATSSIRVFDATHQAEFGVIPYEFAAVGCTDRHEALRRAVLKMIMATTETEMVSFRTNRRGLFVAPYDVILIGDPDKGTGLTGRVMKVDSTRRLLTLDKPLYLEVNIPYRMDIDCEAQLRTVTLTSSVSAWTMVVEINSDYPEDAPEFAAFTLGSPVAGSGVPKPFRVLRVTEESGNPDRMLIEGIEINRNKWILSDRASPKASLGFVDFPQGISAPTNLRVTTETVSVNNEPRALAVVSFTPSIDPRVNFYVCEYRRSGALDWVRAGSSRAPRIEIFDVPSGTFDVRVGAQAGIEEVSWATLLNVGMGLTVPPSDVASLSVSLLGDTMGLQWPPVPDRDLDYYYIKHTPVIGPSATWATAVDLVQKATSTNIRVPLLSGTFFVKAVDQSGIESNNAAFTTSTATVLGLNAAWSQNFQPTWSAGIQSGLFVDAGLLKTYPGGTGSFQFESIDLGAPFVSRLSLEIVGSGERPDANMVFWDRLSDLESISNVTARDYAFEAELAISLDGTTFGDWAPFSVGDYRGRKFRWRVKLISRVPMVSTVLLSLKATVDMPDRVVSQRDVAVPTSGLRINYSPTFREQPSIGITGKNFQTGDYFVPSAQSNTGFDIIIRNSAGTPVLRTIDWIAVGYGIGE